MADVEGELQGVVGKLLVVYVHTPAGVIQMYPGLTVSLVLDLVACR